MGRALTAIVFVWVAGASLVAQQPTSTESAPRTKVQAFEAQTGTVIIRGVTKVGTIQGWEKGRVEVESVEVTDATNGKKEYGLVVKVYSSVLTMVNISAVDYEEIDSLLKGIDYVARVDASVTRFGTFAAKYHTKDDFWVLKDNNNTKGSLDASVGSGSAPMIFVKSSDLQTFRALVEKAKATIDAVRGGSAAR